MEGEEDGGREGEEDGEMEGEEEGGRGGRRKRNGGWNGVGNMISSFSSVL